MFVFLCIVAAIIIIGGVQFIDDRERCANIRRKRELEIADIKETLKDIEDSENEIKFLPSWASFPLSNMNRDTKIKLLKKLEQLTRAQGEYTCKI